MILIIATTNRRNSKTYKIAEYYQQLLHRFNTDEEPQILSLENLPPHFASSALYEATGEEDAFSEMLRQMKAADKYVLIVPEYNASFPGVLKSFIDGLGWPNAMRGKLAALAGISDGVMGGVHALSHLTDVLHYIGCSVLPILVRIPSMKKNFTDGEIQDEFIRGLVREQVRELSLPNPSKRGAIET